MFNKVIKRAKIRHSINKRINACKKDMRELDKDRRREKAYYGEVSSYEPIRQRRRQAMQIELDALNIAKATLLG